MEKAEKSQQAKDVANRARDDLEKAEGGNTGGAHHLKQERKRDPATETAVEQEASDGPEGRGLAR